MEDLIGYHEGQRRNLHVNIKVVIDDVTWRLSERIVDNCQGSLNKTLGAVKNNQTYFDDVKLRVGAQEVRAS